MKEKEKRREKGSCHHEVRKGEKRVHKHRPLPFLLGGVRLVEMGTGVQHFPIRIWVLRMTKNTHGPSHFSIFPLRTLDARERRDRERRETMGSEGTKGQGREKG